MNWRWWTWGRRPAPAVVEPPTARQVGFLVSLWDELGYVVRDVPVSKWEATRVIDELLVERSEVRAARGRPR